LAVTSYTPYGTTLPSFFSSKSCTFTCCGGGLVDHATDVPLFAENGNPQDLSRSDAQPADDDSVIVGDALTLQWQSRLRRPLPPPRGPTLRPAVSIWRIGCLARTMGRSAWWQTPHDHQISCSVPWSGRLSRSTIAGPVAELVGIEGGVASGVTNLESPSVEVPGRRPRHEECYQQT
jgi:hypothetical protein